MYFKRYIFILCAKNFRFVRTFIFNISFNKTFHRTFFTDLSDQSPDEADAITQENSIDITAFLFPAIGAVLMLIFGGLLFSSGTSFSKTKTMPESRLKKKFEQQYGRRTIRFHNIPDKIAKEPSSVLQQENNDVVDAVRKEYNDLPQYQPISALVSNIAGLQGQTCEVNIIRPEVTERGVSPIHLATREYTSDYDNPSYKDKDSDAEHEDEVNKKNLLTITLQDKDIVGEDDYTQRNCAASSGIGTNSPDSYEIDSLEEFPTSKNDSLDLAEAEIPGLRGGAPLHDSANLSVHAYDRRVYGGGRLSVLEIKRAPSSMCLTGCSWPMHRTEGGRMDTRLRGARTSNGRLTWGDIALNVNGNLPLENESDVSNACGDLLRFATPSAEISGPLTAENMREMSQSPLQRMDLEKWLHDVEKSRKTGEVAYDQTIEFPDAKTEKRRRDYLTAQGKEFVPSRRKMRAPLQESLQLLKKLQFVVDDDLASAQNPVHLGGRASCLDTVRAPSSLCLCGDHCRVHGQNKITSDQCIAQANVIEDDTETDAYERTEIAKGSHQLDSTRTERITKGGRQSTLNLLRASSGMCIRGPTCRVHCHKMGHAELLIPESGIESGRSLALSQKQEINSELNELRGASAFGELQLSLTHNPSNDHGISDCAQEQGVSKTTEWGENECRGASSFEESRSAKTQEINDLNTRGASSFAEQPPERLHVNHSHETNSIQSYLGDIRGASGFAPLDESIAGTSSVTLSFAVESDVESFSVEKSLIERKRGTCVGTVVEKGGAPNRNCGSKIRAKAPLSPTEKQNNQTNTLKTEDNEKIVEQNSNSLRSHNKGCKTGTFVRAEKPDICDEDKQRYKRFDERILKVGKDTTMMCTLLNALRRDGKQKRDTETSNDDIIHRIDEENLTNDREASVGSLKFSVLYKGADSVTPLLYVTVLGLEGVSNEAVTKESTVYVKVCLSPKFTTWRRTRALNVSEKLVFKDHFIISGVKPVDLEEAILRFVVVCVREDEQVIGELDVPLEELKSRDKFKRTCALHVPRCPKNDGITSGSELE